MKKIHVWVDEIRDHFENRLDFDFGHSKGPKIHFLVFGTIKMASQERFLALLWVNTTS